MAEEPQRSRIEFQRDIGSLRGENETLRLQNTTLASQIEALTTKIAELEKSLGRKWNSGRCSP